MKLLHTIMAHFPRRRRRFWRFVSPRRRGAGVLLVALLVTVVYGYWYLTNDGRVRQMARDYLSRLAGGRAEVDSARFSLFGGIEMHGVRIYLPGGEVPLLEAPLVVMHNRPWGLFFRRRLDVARIACPGAIVTVAKNRDTGRFDVAEALLRRADAADVELGDLKMLLPEVVARGAELRVDTVYAGLRVRGGRYRLNLSGTPIEDHSYLISLEDLPAEADLATDATAPRGRDSKLFGSIRVNLATGEISGPVDVDLGILDDPLLEDYLSWKRRYRIEGRIGVDVRWLSKQDRGRFEAVLRNVSLQLPEDEGGLRLENVGGTITFTERGAVMKGVSGRVIQAGGARFVLDGNYAGYDANSPFALDLKIQKMIVPPPAGKGGKVADLLAHLHKKFSPTGRWDLSVSVVRAEKAGEIKVTGTAIAKGGSLTEKSFPYRIEKLEGQIVLKDNRMEIRNLRGRHGQAVIRINGSVIDPATDTEDINLVITGEDLAFDDDLRLALRDKFKKLWDDFSPRGRASFIARVIAKPGQKQRIEVDLKFNGGASLTYRGFPYRLDNVSGTIRFAPDRTLIQSLASRSGNKNCTINGTIRHTPPGQSDIVDINIHASVPLDGELAAALGKTGRSLFEALHPKGQAVGINANVRARPGKDLDYTITVPVRNVGFKWDAFPYAVTGAAGTLVITPDLIEIEKITGRHGDTSATITGKVFLDRKPIGLHLQVNAHDVVADPALAEAVPPAVKRLLADLSPKGSADVVLEYKQNTPQTPDANFYSVVIRPKKMQVRHRALPILFRGVTGEVIVLPGRVKFNDLIASDGKMTAKINGEVLLDEQVRSGDLQLKATDVPITKELLAALSQAKVPSLGLMRPKGTCGFDFRTLRFNRLPEPTTRPATGPATPGQEWTWSLDGNMVLDDVDLDLVLGKRTISASLTGSAALTAQGLDVDANVVVQRLAFGAKAVTDVRGKVRKKPRGTIVKISDLVGRSHGGVLSGMAEIRLSDPLQYGFRLSVENVDLDDLLNAGVKDPKRRLGVRGRLGGIIQITATEGDKPIRQVAGRLHITKAKLVRMPILLDALNVLSMDLPSAWAFNEAYLTYHLKGQKVRMQEIYLLGSGMSVVGSGQIDVKTGKLDLTFLTGPPGKLPRISNLAEEFLTGILREIVEYRVTGTLKNPRHRTVPLRAINEIIKTLLSPGK